MIGDVVGAYRSAWRRLPAFTALHLALRALVLAVLVPLSTALLAVAIATSGQSALTDQDIARFLLTPVGAVGALAVLSLAIAAAVLDVAVMTTALRSPARGIFGTLSLGLGTAVRRLPRILAFAARLVVRVLLLAAPFLAAAGLVALFALPDYDINYYLTHRPPAFLLAAGLIAALAVALVLLLLERLSAWAVALHLVLFAGTAPRDAFRTSAAKLEGRKTRVIGRVALWLLLRLLLAGLVAAALGGVVNAFAGAFGDNLRLAAAAMLVTLTLWALANAVVAAFANGALADLLHRIYADVSGGAPDAREAGALEREAARGAGWAPRPGVALAVAAVVLAGGLALGGALAKRASAERTVEIIAHRGAAGARPENTMAAVVKAVEDRADWVEVDVQETADGEVIVAHDSDFMKLAGVDLKVWDATMAELAGIDIGSWFDPAWSGERTPTLRQVLEAVRGRSRLLIELKYYGHDVDLENRVARIVDEAGMAQDVAVMSLKYAAVQKMAALRPDWRRGVLAARAIGDLSALDADFLAVNTGAVSLRLIRRAHAQGKEVYAWTVDDPMTMSRMISMGVDGLITNEPALARRVMEARNDLSVPERLALWLTDQFRIGSFELVAAETDA